ncbi:putative membrane protein [Peptoniphilus duerdenii ATCC BAA-1640]|uniref:Putative membrane protein n=1 Tax=Peptoniphilus duerdenii ATCC BAA-1640 TaxID=862517 RepID=E0NKM0_9FIRM|nr:DMT family transporter [Peptoniphilus duerdenii]EFM25647.1 putative membrane protein [Peptoniphilus duerdenii ATCC BAA-1640]
MEKFFKNKKNAIILSLFAMLLWGSAIPLIKTTYKVMQVPSDDFGLKILIAGVRFFMAGILAIFYHQFFKTKESKFSKLNLKFVIILSLVQTTFQYFFYYIGLSNTHGVKASIIQAFGSFLIVIMAAAFIPGERLNLNKVLAVIIGTAGILVTNLNGDAGGGISLKGEGFIIIATFFNALATILVRLKGRNQDPFLLTGSQFAIGGLVLIFGGIFLKKSAFYLSPLAFIMLTYGAFISATAFSLWTIVLQYHSAGEFGIYKLFIPIFGTILSIIFLKEKFTFLLFIGLALVIIGTLVLNMKNLKKSSSK